MASPLRPVQANLFMGYNEQKWLEPDHAIFFVFLKMGIIL